MPYFLLGSLETDLLSGYKLVQSLQSHDATETTLWAQTLSPMKISFLRQKNRRHDLSFERIHQQFSFGMREGREKPIRQYEFDLK